MEKLPPLSAIRAFEAAGRHENFSRAADELGLTQAAISYQIRQLEDRLGKPLFVREKGRVRLSDSGLRLLPAISSGFADIAEAFVALREEDQDILSVNTSVSLGGSWLSSRMGRFQLRHPDLAVRISLANELVDFGLGGIDVAIRAGKGRWDGLRSDFLFRQHFSPICSPEFLKANDIRSPRDLLSVERLDPNDRLWADWFAAAGICTPPPPRRGVMMDSQWQEATMIQSGFGIAMMSPLYWKSDLESGRLVQPFGKLFVSADSQWLVHPVNRIGVRKIERLREWLHEEVAADRDFLPSAIWDQPE